MRVGRLFATLLALVVRTWTVMVAVAPPVRSYQPLLPLAVVVRLAVIAGEVRLIAKPFLRLWKELGVWLLLLSLLAALFLSPRRSALPQLKFVA